MPRFAGVNIVGVLVATCAFYFIGFLFYGVLFQTDWTLETLVYLGAVDADKAGQLSDQLLMEVWTRHFPESNPALSMGLGFLNALITVSLLAFILRHLTSEAPGLAAYALSAILICAGFVITTLAYGPIYTHAPIKLMLIDSAHLMCAYVSASVVLFLMD